jgi:TetR/AcrR family transcriptional regulator, transcriptional repressor of aconitase
MPKVSQAHLDARRAEILEGAREAFARFGYEGATVARLEEATGLSRGAIFHYYKSKLDLFVALAQSDNTRYQDVMIEGGLEELVRAIGAADPQWVKVLIETQVKLLRDPRFQEQLTTPKERQEEIVGAFERAQREGRMRDDVSALDLVRFTTMIVNGLALRVAAGDSTNVDALVVLVHDAVRPRA